MSAPEPSVVALVEQQAVRSPSATAVSAPEGDTCFAALVTRAGVIGDALLARGLQPEEPVGVLMHRTAELLAVLLGVMRAGGCYVPLDPDDPASRNAAILDAAQCRFIVGHGVLLDAMRQDRPALELLDVDLLHDEPGASSTPRRAPAPGGNHLAYVLFTSGTTGVPKGVEVTHRSVVNLLHASRELFAFTDADRYLATSTVGFDISVAELFLPLITGGTVVLRDRRLLQDPHGLVDTIRAHGVTVFQTGPSVWSVLLDEIDDFPHLRIAISTGEAIAPELARRLARVGDRVWNLYGPTEATVWATGHVMEGTDLGTGVSAPIGRPLPGVEALIVDETGAAVADGAEGELWLGGVALARGYRGDPERTSARFVTRDGTRWYRTGDVVRCDADGTIHYLGRNDDQIKVHGVRIEPMEVEGAIVRQPGIAQAAATWFETPTGARSIVAAVVPRPGAALDSTTLHRAVGELLPSAMIPSRFVVVDALPLTPAGKVDRGAIRGLARAAATEVADATFDAPQTATERELARIWARALGVDRVARTDHFFTIGGDSLSAVTMLLEAEESFGMSLPVRVVFEAPTLDRLAARIDANQTQPDLLDNASFVFPLVTSGSGTPVFFSAVDLKLARRGVWLADCPLYAISQWAQGAGFAKATSLEALAETHLASVRTIQPAGPYRLAGYSFGGLIALEMAQQLRRANEDVDLFLLDPTEPQRPGTSTEFLRTAPSLRGHDEPRERLVARILRHARHVAGHPREAAQYVGSRTRALAGHAAITTLNLGGRAPTWQWINYQLMHLHGRHPNPVSTKLLPKDKWPAFWYTARRLGKTYIPTRYDGPVVAVFVEEGDRAEQWRPLLPNADVHVLVGAHTEMFGEPTMSAWLRIAREHFDASDPAGPPDAQRYTTS